MRKYTYIFQYLNNVKGLTPI